MGPGSAPPDSQTGKSRRSPLDPARMCRLPARRPSPSVAALGANVVVDGVRSRRAPVRSQTTSPIAQCHCTHPQPAVVSVGLAPRDSDLPLAPTLSTALGGDGHRCAPTSPCLRTATAIAPVPAACETKLARPCSVLVSTAPPLPPWLCTASQLLLPYSLDLTYQHVACCSSAS